MATHKETLQAAVDAAQKEHSTAANEESRLRGELNAERSAIETLETKYSDACRAVASGDSKADPATILAERDRRRHRLTGLEQLHKTALDASQAASVHMQAAQIALQEQLDVEERERLEAVITAAQKKRSEAQAALNAADAELSAAAWARRQFLHQQELKTQARA